MAGRYARKWLGILLAGLITVMCPTQIVWATEKPAAAAGNAAPEPTPTPEPIPIETNFITGWPQGPEVTSETACLIEANTGAVLYNKAMTQKMHPASTTKVMTALLVLENAELNETFTFTETGVAEAYSGSSNLITQVGEQFTVEDALHALMLKSANDFASQIAEYVGGSVENFVQMMNDKAAELGCVNTHFNNAHGMTDENHYSCAYDLTLIMQEACKNPDFCRIAGTLKYIIPATHLTPQRTVETHNGLIMEGENYYEWCIAGKTGYTDAAWCTFVSVAEKDGMKLIEATMRTTKSALSFSDAKLLYEYGFGNFQNLPIQENVQLYEGGMATVPVGASKDMIVAEQGDSFETILGTMVNETYFYNGHQVGDVAVSMEYIAELEAEEVMRAQQEEEARVQQQEAAALQAENDLFDEKMKTIFQMIMVILLVCIAVGIFMIIMGLLRKRRSSLYLKRMSEKEKGER